MEKDRFPSFTSSVNHSRQIPGSITLRSVPAHAPNLAIHPAYVLRVSTLSPLRAPVEWTAAFSRSGIDLPFPPPFWQISNHLKYHRIPSAHWLNCQSCRGFATTASFQNVRALSRPGGRFSRTRQSSNQPTTNPNACTSLRVRSRDAFKSSLQLKAARGVEGLGEAFIPTLFSRTLSLGNFKIALSFCWKFRISEKLATAGVA
ncbi:MAG: hypothetical protein V4819_23670 [Verrucomicrobiota bacterium]